MSRGPEAGEQGPWVGRVAWGMGWSGGAGLQGPEYQVPESGRDAVGKTGGSRGGGGRAVQSQAEKGENKHGPLRGQVGEAGTQGAQGEEGLGLSMQGRRGQGLTVTSW